MKYERAAEKSFLRRFDHIDLRVPSLAVARSFYAVLLPALGFSKDVSDETWFQFEGENPSGVAEFFGITESANHRRFRSWRVHRCREQNASVIWYRLGKRVRGKATAPGAPALTVKGGSGSGRHDRGQLSR